MQIAQRNKLTETVWMDVNQKPENHFPMFADGLVCEFVSVEKLCAQLNSNNQTGIHECDKINDHKSSSSSRLIWRILACTNTHNTEHTRVLLLLLQPLLANGRTNGIEVLANQRSECPCSGQPADFVNSTKWYESYKINTSNLYIIRSDPISFSVNCESEKINRDFFSISFTSMLFCDLLAAGSAIFLLHDIIFFDNLQRGWSLENISF